ncbi:hypothetical protein BG011_002471 [Mortierella polycephala]|uniref:Core Histone H2A/H2B/H3 domain-containing protein n=1 Tax=Mortierella polycephala TaxID=41804 RepID=A0A9P6QDN9_9FUNG|nr:hypothetical protein BG011_002471 [Mortierella polycephala]
MSHQRQDSSGSSYDPAAAAAAAEKYHQHQMQLQQQQYHMLPPMSHPPPPPLQHHHDPSLAHQQPMQQAHMHLLQSFWMNQMHEIENVPQDFKLHHLPLARIKKVMKTDEDVKAKMISAEAPMIFDKGCEIFITELTIRAWIHAEENKRRTLQRSDIAAAISKTDMFDFLIDIVPREEFKMGKESKSSSSHQGGSAGGSEHRRSQESFPPVGPSVGSSAGAAGPGGMNPPGLEGYGYPYGMLENGSFPMGPGEALDPYQQQQQQQQQQQLQLQYMRAQMTQQGQQPSAPSPQQQQQRYEFQQQASHDISGEGPPQSSQLPPETWS